MQSLHFQDPEFFFTLLAIPLLIADYIYNLKRKKTSVRFSDVSVLKNLPSSFALKMRHILIVLRCLAVAFFAVAMARPQSGETFEEQSTEGVDIVMALDVSGSMEALDMITNREMAKIGRKDAHRFYTSGEYLQYSRLGAAKKVINDFVDKRKTDRLGLVVFAGRSYTQCPLTLDHGILKSFLKGVSRNSIEAQGTAIGSAIMSATNRLKDSKAKSKVIILLTDGASNAGAINPAQAAKVSKKLGIKVYTIGVGKKSGTQLTWVQNPFTGEVSWSERPIDPAQGVDEKLMKSVAKTTGGQYYHAQNKEELRKIYETIDTLEKTEIESLTYTKYQEEFFLFLLIGAGLIFLEIILANTRFLKIP